MAVLRSRVSRSTYWVRYRSEDDRGGYRLKTAHAGTLMALAAQINELLDRGWEVVALGATSPRELYHKERQVVDTLTRGRMKSSK